MYSTAAIGKKTKESPYDKITIERGWTGEDDIDIDIKYCGFCHTDVHLANNDWGFSQYPNVPGHEIAGVVTKVNIQWRHSHFCFTGAKHTFANFYWG